MIKLCYIFISILQRTHLWTLTQSVGLYLALSGLAVVNEAIDSICPSNARCTLACSVISCVSVLTKQHFFCTEIFLFAASNGMVSHFLF